MPDRSPQDININIKQSGLVSSSQRDVHPNLEQVVRKHLATTWKQPFHQATLEVYRQLLKAEVFSQALPLILDSGCGTGNSSSVLAELFPNHLVLGVDRSHVRLSKSGLESGFHRRGNCVLIRAELATFWRLLLKDGHTLEQHFLLYPKCL